MAVAKAAETPLGAGGGFLERPRGLPRGLPDLPKLSPYELHPLHLLAYHGNWYMLALNSAKGRVGTFALSRFRKVEGSGRTFQRPEGFDARSHARQAFGITAEEKPMRVRLLSSRPSWPSTSPSDSGTPAKC